jgi:hypothetical protein
MVLSIIFLEDKHKILFHCDVFLSWTRIMSVLIGWPISNTLTPHGKKMHVKEIYVIFIHLFDSGHRICFSIQPQLQLVNLHRNRRYFVIKLHTWFCLSYFLKTNIKLYYVLKWVTGHCNRAAVSRNRYGVNKTIDTHKILINAIQFYVYQ